MIYTITFNPAIDYVVKIENFKINKINKTNSELVLPGGKGINVSVVLKNLGIDSIAFGFIANFTGKKIEELVKKNKVKTDFIKVKNGFSRINVKVDSNNKETAINASGPRLLKEEINELLKKIDKIEDGDILILSGSIPKCIDKNIYEIICKRLENKNVRVIVDATDNLLINVLKYKPYLIKPNEEELEEIFKIKIKNENEVIKYAKKLQEKGAQNVLVSMGEKGAILIDSNKKEYKMKAPQGKRVNTVGAGDSMIAGFIAGMLKYDDYEKALKLGVASGSASACSEYLATKEEIEEFLEKVNTQ